MYARNQRLEHEVARMHQELSKYRDETVKKYHQRIAEASTQYEKNLAALQKMISQQAFTIQDLLRANDIHERNAKDLSDIIRRNLVVTSKTMELHPSVQEDLLTTLKSSIAEAKSESHDLRLEVHTLREQLSRMQESEDAFEIEHDIRMKLSLLFDEKQAEFANLLTTVTERECEIMKLRQLLVESVASAERKQDVHEEIQEARNRFTELVHARNEEILTLQGKLRILTECPIELQADLEDDPEILRKKILELNVKLEENGSKMQLLFDEIQTWVHDHSNFHSMQAMDYLIRTKQEQVDHWMKRAQSAEALLDARTTQAQ